MCVHPRDRPTAKGARRLDDPADVRRSEEHTSELQSLTNLVCRLLLEKKKHSVRPRAALSSRFPGALLLIPAGNHKTRSNATQHPCQASVAEAYLNVNLR